MTTWTVYAGDPQRAVGTVTERPHLWGNVRIPKYHWQAAMPDPYDGPAAPRMTYDDSTQPVRFQSAIADGLTDAIKAVCRASVGPVGADANLTIEREG